MFGCTKLIKSIFQSLHIFFLFCTTKPTPSKTTNKLEKKIYIYYYFYIYTMPDDCRFWYGVIILQKTKSLLSYVCLKVKSVFFILVVLGSKRIRYGSRDFQICHGFFLTFCFTKIFKIKRCFALKMYLISVKYDSSSNQCNSSLDYIFISFHLFLRWCCLFQLW